MKQKEILYKYIRINIIAPLANAVKAVLGTKLYYFKKRNIVTENNFLEFVYNKFYN